MKEELQNNIINSFPELFAINKNIEPGQPFYPIKFGLECGGGWYYLIYSLCEQITNYLSFKEIEVDVKITQIKEKFGILCFYITEADDYIRGLISNAEHLSFYICERCGSFENGRTSGRWVYNCCKKCFDEKIDDSRKFGLEWKTVERHNKDMAKFRKGEIEESGE